MKEQNKIIIKNTIAQYIRVITTALVSIISVRIVLNKLGTDDYGIFSVIAGFIALFGVLNSSLIVSIQRHISYEIPTGNNSKISTLYSTSFTIHILLAIIVFILSETVGLYFMVNFMKFPVGRLDAAILVFHSVVISFILNIISIPQQAILIAYEKIYLSSVIGIIDVFLKLAIAILLVYIDSDKLIFYAYGCLIIAIITFILYLVSTYISIKQIRLKITIDKTCFHQLIGFASWNLFGGIANLGKIQGVNVLLNIFFGTAINAAYGLANVINSQLLFFSSSIFQSSNSQIIQSYRKHDYERLNFITSQTTKFAFIIYFCITSVFLISSHEILTIWLGNVPPYCSIFVRLMLLNSYIELFSSPLMFIMQASGNIKNYFLCISSVMILILPISYVLLKCGAEPYTVLTITITINLILLYIRIWFVKNKAKIPIQEFVYKVILPCLLLFALATPILYAIYLSTGGTWGRIIITTCSSILVVGTLSYFFVLSKDNRKFIKSHVFRS